MRHGSVLLKTHRVRSVLPKEMFFQELMQMKLKNRVSSKGTQLGSGHCVAEMSALLTCMKRADFDEGPCSKELTAFTKCVEEDRKVIAEAKQLLKQGALMPGASRMTSLQLTTLMKKWPVPGAGTKKLPPPPAPPINYSDD